MTCMTFTLIGLMPGSFVPSVLLTVLLASFWHLFCADWEAWCMEFSVTNSQNALSILFPHIPYPAFLSFEFYFSSKFWMMSLCNWLQSRNCKVRRMPYWVSFSFDLLNILGLVYKSSLGYFAIFFTWNIVFTILKMYKANLAGICCWSCSLYSARFCIVVR